MSDKKTCGTCCHWGYEGDDAPFRPCQAVVHDSDWRAGPVNEDYAKEKEADLQERMAENPELKAEVEVMRKHLAVVQDGESYYAALKTRKEFGCVLWEADEALDDKQEITYGTVEVDDEAFTPENTRLSVMMSEAVLQAIAAWRALTEEQRADFLLHADAVAMGKALGDAVRGVPDANPAEIAARLLKAAGR